MLSLVYPRCVVKLGGDHWVKAQICRIEHEMALEVRQEFKAAFPNRRCLQEE